MYNYLKKSRKLKTKRALRVRKRLRGTAEKPRLTVHRSNRNLFAQLIDDEKGITLASYSTVVKGEKGTDNAKKSKASAKHIGQKIGEAAKKQKIEAAVFDRGHNKYHGLLAELAEGARETGLKF